MPDATGSTQPLTNGKGGSVYGGNGAPDSPLWSSPQYQQEGTSAADAAKVDKGKNLETSNSNKIFIVGMSLNAAGLTASAREYSKVNNGMWKGINGKWNSLDWGGNKWTGPRANAVNTARTFRNIGRGAFIVGTGISIYQGVISATEGDYDATAKSGADIIFGGIATFGGPYGAAIGGTYYGLDFLYQQFPYQHLPLGWNNNNFAPPDKTYVAPPFRLK